MRPTLIVLAIVGVVIPPVSFAQSTLGVDAGVSAPAAAATSRDVAPPPYSKAHRAMASFTSLLREAALQSQLQSTQRAAVSSQPVATRPVPAGTDGGDALALKSDRVGIH